MNKLIALAERFERGEVLSGAGFARDIRDSVTPATLAAEESLRALESLMGALLEKNSDFKHWDSVRQAREACYKARGFGACCGGSDEWPAEHTQDCPAKASGK